jgi:uncharacterized protein YggE
MFENCQIGNKCLLNLLVATLWVLLVALVFSTAIDVRDKMQETENTITVTESGEVYAKPDLALITFSVTNEAKTVAEALSENTKNMNAVIEAVKEQGVEEKDLKTTNFNIYPRYEWRQTEICLIPPCPSGERTLVGYEVNQSLQVKIRDLEKTAEILQAAADAGANQVGDLQFTVDKEDEFKKQAREEAIKKAKAKAQELAKELGVRLVRVSNFSESGLGVRYYALEKSAVPAAMGGEEEMPEIETGENKIEVTVTITYDIK